MQIHGKITLPERKPFEGNATQKQKHLLWELGVRDEALIRTIGKSQASYVIDTILAHKRRVEMPSRLAGNLIVAFVVVGGVLLMLTIVARCSR